MVGVITFGTKSYLLKLNSLVLHNQFQNKEQEFMDWMFDYNIRLFHKRYTNEQVCETNSLVSSKPVEATVNELELNSIPKETELCHEDCKNVLLQRDVLLESETIKRSSYYLPKECFN